MSQAARAHAAPDYRESSAPHYQEVISNDPKPAPPLFTHYSETQVDCSGAPRSEYTSPDFARLELERMWPRVWQVGCREEQIPEVGDILVYDSPGLSLLIVRSAPDEIKAYHNSCLHRGMKLCTHDTSVQRLNCPFHGFSWRLDGKLDFVPARWDFPQLEEAKYNLPEAKVGRWGGFVFINRDLDGKPLEEYLGHLPEHFVGWSRDAVYAAKIIRKTINANWKTCIEGFIESFHLAGIHAQALPFGGDASTQYDVWPDDENVSRFLEPTGVQSDQYPRQLSEQQVLDAAIRLVFGAAAEVPELSEGMRARSFLADATRQMMSVADGRDYSSLSDAESADAMQYSVFPNFILFRSLTYPYAYRFTPVRDNPNAAVFDFYIFLPKPADGIVPETVLVELGAEDSFSKSSGLPPWLGQIYDQDTAGLAMCQEGLRDGGTADVMYSAYQEVRIRHLHQTLARYIAMPAA